MQLLSNGWYFVNILKNASTSLREHRVGKRVDFHEKSFAVIRNPLDRLVSCFENREYSIWDRFIDYVCETPDEEIDKHCASQTSFLDPFPTLLIDFDNLEFELGLIGLEINHRNPSYKSPLSEYYSEDDFLRVYERYLPDFELWQVVTSTPEIYSRAKRLQRPT